MAMRGNCGRGLCGCSHNFKEQVLIRYNEACFEDPSIVGSYFCCVDWPITSIINSTELYLVVASLSHCLLRMLWIVNGRSWSDAISHLSSRGNSVTTGHC